MCGGKTKKTTQKSTQTTKPAPEAMAYYKQLMGRLGDVGQLQYDPYTGERVAGFTPYQEQAMQGIYGLQGAGAGTLQEAVRSGMRGAAPITGQDIQRYQDPYQEMVLNAMTAKMRQQEAEDISKLQGTSISAGAYGGDRAKLAQAQMMRNQEQERNMRMSELMSKGYSNALAAAQADREAATRGAGMLQSLAGTEFTQPLAQTQALYGAGAQQQALEQQRLNIPYETYLEQRAFPYQQLQYLAGIGTGVGSQMGGTSAGTAVTTQPGPSMFSQLLGAGLSLGMAPVTGGGSLMGNFFGSDERLKENIEDVGVTNDGQTIYKYNYKGDPRTHLGLLAQEVEQTYPEAVGQIAGFKTVNYDLATKNAVRKADGGGLQKTSVFQKGYIPGIDPVKGQGAPGFSNMSSPSPEEDTTLDDIVDKAMSLAKTMREGTTETTSGWEPTITPSYEMSSTPGTSSMTGNIVPSTITSPSEAFFAMPVNYAHGGGINIPHYDNGGGTEDDKWKSPQIMNLPYSTSDLSKILNKNLEAPTETAVVKEELPTVEIPQQEQPSAGISKPYGEGISGGTSGKGSSLLGGLLGLSPETEQAGMAAGLAMMAGQSPFALSNIGQGGLAGVKYYNEIMKAKQEQALKEKEIAAKGTKPPKSTGLVTTKGDEIFFDQSGDLILADGTPVSPDEERMQKKEYLKIKEGERKKEGQIPEAQKKYIYQTNAFNTIKEKLEKLKKNVNWLTVGEIADISKNIPLLRTQAKDFQADLDSVVSDLTLKSLLNLRANSPTGGALGNVSDKDLAVLSTALGNLQKPQSREHLIQTMDDIINQFNSMGAASKQGFINEFGEDKLPTMPEGTATGTIADPANPKNLPIKMFTDDQGKPVKGIQVDGQWMDIRNYKP